VKSKLASVAIVMLVISLLVVGCGPTPTPTAVPPTEAPTQAPAPTEAAAPTEAPKVYKVGYSVIVALPSLELGMNGLVAGLAEAGFVEGENLVFEVQNAQGEVTNAHNIAEKFVADKMDLIIGHTTPCAQAVVKASEGTDIPILFFGISDPVGAGLVKSVDEPSGTNVTGEWGPTPVEDLFELYAEIMPDMKKVGAIYNPSETNSVVEVGKSKAIADKKGYEWFEATVTSSADVKTAAESLVGKVDAIVIPQDNTVVSALEAAIKVGEDNQIPVFPMDPDSVERGAVASLASDPYNDGMLAGAVAAQLLQGEDPGTIVPVKPTEFNVYVNLEAAKKMGITVPQAVVDRAFKVYGAEAAAGPEPGKTYRVGYSVIVSHPSLEASQKGIMDALAEAGFVEGKNLIFEVQNAQGEITNAHNIAQKFVADKVDVILGMTTPCAQAIVQAAKGTDIPVVFLAITDPVGAGLVESLDKPSGTNVTGFYTPGALPESFDVYAEIMPSMKKVGTIYNPAEDNAVAEVEECKKIAAERGYEWIEATVTSTADVKTAAESLVGKADAIVIVHDNTVVSAIDAVVKVGEDNKIPVFPMDPDSVERGAVAALSGDPYTEGTWMGELVVRVLLGEDPGTITPVKPTEFNLYLNPEAAERMGITVPQAVVDRAFKIYE
jgi:putative ABC transport system substrate-binding protein